MKKNLGISISRVDFSEPQGGKSICDGRAAHVKAYVRRYVNEGNNVITANDFMKAVETTMPNVKVIVSMPPASAEEYKSPAKLDSITSLNDFCSELIGW